MSHFPSFSDHTLANFYFWGLAYANPSILEYHQQRVALGFRVSACASNTTIKFVLCNHWKILTQFLVHTLVMLEHSCDLWPEAEIFLMGCASLFVYSSAIHSLCDSQLLFDCRWFLETAEKNNVTGKVSVVKKKLFDKWWGINYSTAMRALPWCVVYGGSWVKWMDYFWALTNNPLINFQNSKMTTETLVCQPIYTSISMEVKELPIVAKQTIPLYQSVFLWSVILQGCISTTFWKK